MMTHTQKMLRSLPQGKARSKVLRTVQGSIIVLIGAVLTIGTFWIVGALKEFDKWMLAPLGLGVILILIGATFWSTEIMHYILKDAMQILRRSKDK